MSPQENGFLALCFFAVCVAHAVWVARFHNAQDTVEDLTERVNILETRLQEKGAPTWTSKPRPKP